MAILGRHTVWYGLSAFIVIWSMLLGWNWPFTQHAVVTALQHETGHIVKVGIFHATFFPPGYVAENLILTRRTAQVVEDPITVRKFVVVARWTDLLLMRKRLDQARIVGLRLRSPMGTGSDGKPARAAQDRRPRFLEVGRVEINDAVFAFSATAKDPDPFTITVQSFWLDHLNQGSPSPFKTRLFVSEPKITVRSEGQVGPWDWNDIGRAALSGFFVIERAALNGLGGVAGDFTGSGNFHGSLRHIASVGTVDIPYFRVDGNEHSGHLFTTFRASINGLNGDTTLDRAQARLNGTLIKSEGAIKTEPKMPGKAASLHLSIDEGHIEDFLFLLTRKTQPSMTGDIKLQAQGDIPPGAPGFLEKISLHGNFERSIIAGSLALRHKRPLTALAKARKAWLRARERLVRPLSFPA